MEAYRLGEVLWNYLLVRMPLDRREAIIAFGGHDLRVAEWAAQLWLDGLAPVLVCSGGLGYYTSKIWNEPESHKFRDIALDMGVHRDAILVEDRSTNSGENVSHTCRLLAEKNLTVTRAICVQKPYLERRVSATLKKQWPECDFVLSSPSIPYAEYPSPGVIDREKLIIEMVGQIDRIEKYPRLGFTVTMSIPTEVAEAKAELIDMGYVGHLVAI